MNEQLLATIDMLKKDFSYDEINDYQNLLLIIYNSLFIYEDELTSNVKYKIYELLSTVINNIEEHKYFTSKEEPIEDKIKMLESFLIPYYLQNGINPRYDRIPKKDNKHIKNIERLKK